MKKSWNSRSKRWIRVSGYRQQGVVGDVIGYWISGITWYQVSLFLYSGLEHVPQKNLRTLGCWLVFDLTTCCGFNIFESRLVKLQQQRQYKGRSHRQWFGFVSLILITKMMLLCWICNDYNNVFPRMILHFTQFLTAKSQCGRRLVTKKLSISYHNGSI